MRSESLLSWALLATSLVSVLAAPSKRWAYKLKQEIPPPPGWIKHSDAPADRTISLRIALPQPNFHVLEQHLYEVSDPDHERYGQHLSKDEVDALVAPHDESIDSVVRWLSEFGLSENHLSFSDAKDWITVKVPLPLAETLLDTKYHVWKHEGSGEYVVRTTSYSLPTDLHEHIDLVQPTTMFGRFKPHHSNIAIIERPQTIDVASKPSPVHIPVSGVTVDASCKQNITLSCLKQLYNAVGYVPSTKVKNSIGITGYLGEFANFQDLQSFYAEQLPSAVNTSFTVDFVDNGTNSQILADAGAEANLDVQFAFGLSHPIPGTFFSTGGSPPFKPDASSGAQNDNEPYTEWLDFILAQKAPPPVISTSYGDDEQTVPKDFALRACAGFAQLGARGVSITFSSGDRGVGDGNSDPATQECFTNDGRNVTRFIPLFPASCPFVTSVGGTTSFNPETAVTRFGSGGGFSDYFARPSYQDAVVKKFLNSLPKGTYKGLFNSAGRGIPDVAAQGDHFNIFLGGEAISIGGTSASAPTFAALVALLNDARLRAGQSTLGFLNPFLYSRGVAGLTDITIGSNPGCGTPGFNATKGWDPVTGLGTPNFGKLKELVTTGF